MAVYYLDTSALVKRYAAEPGTTWIMALTDPAARNEIFTVRVAGPELIAALYRKVRTRQISHIGAARCANNFRQDRHKQYLVMEITTGIADRAMDLAEQHELRGYNAVHLAAAQELQTIRAAMQLPAIIFVSADGEQLQAARESGLAIENPDEY